MRLSTHIIALRTLILATLMALLATGALAVKMTHVYIVVSFGDAPTRVVTAEDIENLMPPKTATAVPPNVKPIVTKKGDLK